MIKYLVYTMFFWASVMAMEPAYLVKREPEEKEIILNCSSEGGGGHTSVNAALISYFSPKYEVKTIYPMRDTLASLDLVRTCTSGKYSCEDLYNGLLTSRFNKTINLLSHAGRLQATLRDKTIQQQLYKAFEEIKPRLIVSFIPYINKQIANAAKQLQVPFLLIPTDLDTTTFFYGLTDDIKKSTALALAFNKTEILAACNNLNAFKSVTITGFPVKPEFLKSITKNEKNSICKDFTIPDHKLTCMVLMGAAGSSATLEYTKDILTSMPSLHPIVCLGRNEKLKTEIEKIPLAKDQSLSIVGHTNRIADLMSVSKFIITKSGTVSVCEALKKRLPMILDATVSTPLKWEALNHTIIENYKLGAVMHKREELPSLLKQFANKGLRKTMQSNIRAFDNNNFSDHVQKLIENK